MGQLGGGGGPGYGQQIRTGPQMPTQATYQQQQAPYQGGFTPGAPGAQMMQAGQAVPFQMNGGNGFNGAYGGQPQPMYGRQGNSWYGMNPSQMRAPPKRHPVTGQPVTPPVTPPVDPATGLPPVDPVTGEPVIGIATDVYGHYQGEDGAGGAGAGAYDPNMNPATFGMPTGNRRPQLQALHERLKARNMALQDSGQGVRGSEDQRYTNIQNRLQGLYPKQQQYRAQAKDQRAANLQTLLAAQTAGTTLTPEQLAWVNKMQGTG
jgi:hypothetical protein